MLQEFLEALARFGAIYHSKVLPKMRNNYVTNRRSPAYLARIKQLQQQATAIHETKVCLVGVLYGLFGVRYILIDCWIAACSGVQHLGFLL